MNENVKHELYNKVENDKDSDALAWVWVNKEKVVKFPFKFPLLAPNKIRANVLYVGLCHSDIFNVRDLWHNIMPTIIIWFQGHEFVGEISQVGFCCSAVTTFKKGDKVGFGKSVIVVELAKYVLVVMINYALMLRMI